MKAAESKKYTRYANSESRTESRAVQTMDSGTTRGQSISRHVFPSGRSKLEEILL